MVTFGLLLTMEKQSLHAVAWEIPNAKVRLKTANSISYEKTEQPCFQTFIYEDCQKEKKKVKWGRANPVGSSFNSEKNLILKENNKSSIIKSLGSQTQRFRILLVNSQPLNQISIVLNVACLPAFFPLVLCLRHYLDSWLHKCLGHASYPLIKLLLHKIQCITSHVFSLIFLAFLFQLAKLYVATSHSYVLTI